MRQLICIFFVVILACLTSKLKINIQSLTKQKNSMKIRFHVNVGVYLLGFIKIFGISFQENGIQVLDFHFGYPSVKIAQESMKMFKKNSIIEILKSLKIKLDEFYFTMQIGTEDVMLTTFLVALISTFFSVLSEQNAKSINLKNYHYQIMPIYNENALSLKSSFQISLSIFCLVKAIVLVRKQKKLKQENHVRNPNELIEI